MSALKFGLSATVLALSVGVGIFVQHQRSSPENHKRRLLAEFPALARASIIPGCGMGENYGYFLADRKDYDYIRLALSKSPWRELAATDYEGTISGIGGTKVWVILHEWHRDSSRPHAVFGFE